jgi:hypothetical protein
VLKKLVVVAEVPVAFRKVKFWRVVELVNIVFVNLAIEANKFVELAVVEKKLVVVAEVPVAFRKVKFWRVEEADERKPPVNVPSDASVSVPVKFAAEEMF